MIRRLGPWKHIDEVELATLDWVQWFNTKRLLGPIGDIRPREYEEAFYETETAQAMVA